MSYDLNITGHDFSNGAEVIAPVDKSQEQFDSTDEEIWAPIVDIPGYLISTQGRILSLKKNGTHLRKLQSPKGYKTVGFRENGRTTTYLVHRLMAKTFIPNPDPETKTIVCHKDGTKNNSIDNLYWGTQLENIQDAIRHGSFKNRKGRGQPKLNEEKVLKIREISDQFSQRELGRMFEVDQKTIFFILKRKTWKHI